MKNFYKLIGNLTRARSAKVPLVIIALVVVIGFSFTACSGSGGGGKSLNSATELKEYLDKQPANSPDQPIKVAIKVNDMMIAEIVGIIKGANKYVSLNLSGSPLTEIPQRAFKDCKTLVGITIPNIVTSIGEEAFRNTGLTSITIPNGVTSIGDSVFYGCTGLTSITIPNSVTSIGNSAFRDCTSLADITIPSSITYSIEQSAFFNTTLLNSQPDGLVYVNKILLGYKGTMPANTVINNIRTDTTGIANIAFRQQKNLIGIAIPSSVTFIGDSAFWACDNLTSITIPSSVTSIGNQAFLFCESLTNVTVSRRTRIGEYAFQTTTQITYSD